jgi:hypothetical protein
MAKIISFISPVLNFFRNNFINIMVGIAIVTLVFGVFYFTTLSIKKLKMEVLTYYPFDRFSPGSKKWSILYFLILVVFLAGLAFFLAKF